MSNKEPKKKPGLPKFGLSWIYLSIFVGLLALQFFSNNYSGQTLDSNFSDLKEKISKGHVSVIISFFSYKSCAWGHIFSS